MSTLVSLPRKQTDAADLSRTLSRYVQSNYDAAVYAAHQGAIGTLHQMREDMRASIGQPVTNAAIDLTVQYYYQVLSVEARFPISDHSVCCHHT